MTMIWNRHRSSQVVISNFWVTHTDTVWQLTRPSFFRVSTGLIFCRVENVRGGHVNDVKRGCYIKTTRSSLVFRAQGRSQLVGMVGWLVLVA